MRVTAPGKLMLTGEYAVLEGAPAIVAAVDRRVEVVLRERDAESVPGTLTFRTDLPGEDAVRLDVDEYCAPDSHPRGVCFLRAVVHGALGPAREADVLSTIGAIEVESGALREGVGGPKLGLGSSAAVAAALTAALHAWSAAHDDACEPQDPERVLRDARAAHREAVGGSGSGVDVAACVLGGVHAFRTSADTLGVDAVSLPSGLRVIPVWTGESVDTAEYLSVIRTLADHEPEEVAAAMGALQATAEAAVDACAGDDAPAFLAAVAAYADGMRELGRVAGLSIVSAPHERVIEIARATGAVAKPSGAGGGDVAVVFVPADASASVIEDRLEREGLPPIRTSITPIGVTVENQMRLTP